MNLKYILSLAVIVLAVSAAEAGVIDDGFDYNLEAGGQSYPLGGLVTARAGYGLKLWDQTDAGDSSFWKYGYVRPNIEVNTAGLLNRGSAAVEIFPISIFGLAGGAGFSQRNSSYYQDFDCGLVLCNETLTYNFVRARLLGGIGDYLFSATAKYEAFRSTNVVKPFYDEMSYIVGSPEQDDLKTLNVLAGYKFSERWTLGVMGIFQNFIHSQNNNSSLFLAGNYSEGFWQGSLALGQYKSSHQNSNPAAVISVSYTGKKGLSLLD